MDHEHQYKYQRIDLSTDAIRLVRLLRGFRQDPIQCELVETFLQQVEGVPYEALSYAWGDSPVAYEISINDRRSLVKENLNMALLALRQTDEDRLLWIDAICIDQSNDREKGHQVGQMRRIYENAEQVVIWLGPSNREIDSLMDLARRWDHQTRQRPGADRAQGWISSWIKLTAADETDPYKEELTAGRRNSLQEMLNRPWFRRVWILQEVASARRATLLCGSKAIPSRGFSLLPFLLDLHPEEHTQAVLDILPGYRRKETWWGQKQNLETLLVKFGASEATDQRDNIYALLGIASDAHTSDILRPDYELPFCDVVRNTILFLLSPELDGRHVLRLPDFIDFPDFVRILPRLADCILGWGLLQQTYDDMDTTTANLVPRASDINRLYRPPDFAPVPGLSPLEFTIGKKKLDNTFGALSTRNGADTMLFSSDDMDATTANLVPRASDINRLYRPPDFAPIPGLSHLEFPIGKKNLDNIFGAFSAPNSVDAMLFSSQPYADKSSSPIHEEMGSEHHAIRLVNCLICNQSVGNQKLDDYGFEQLKRILQHSTVSKWKVEDLQSLAYYAAQYSQPKICKLLFEVTHCMDLESSIDTLTRVLSDKMGHVPHSTGLPTQTALENWFDDADSWTIKFIGLMDLAMRRRSLTDLDESQCADKLAELFVEFSPWSDKEPRNHLVKILAAWRLLKRGKRLFVDMLRDSVSLVDYSIHHGPFPWDHQPAMAELHKTLQSVNLIGSNNRFGESSVGGIGEERLMSEEETRSFKINRLRLMEKRHLELEGKWLTNTK